MTTPAARPARAHFSSGPCAKRPGWTPALPTDSLGRSHRSAVGKAFEARGIKVNIALTAADADVIKGYVELGVGVGILAKMAFDPARDPNPHLAFGAGRHMCVGLHLARTVIRTGIEALLRRLPEWPAETRVSLAPGILGGSSVAGLIVPAGALQPC